MIRSVHVADYFGRKGIRLLLGDVARRDRAIQVLTDAGQAPLDRYTLADQRIGLNGGRRQQRTGWLSLSRSGATDDESRGKRCSSEGTAAPAEYGLGGFGPGHTGTRLLFHG